jgi:hypothetical protein
MAICLESVTLQAKLSDLEIYQLYTKAESRNSTEANAILKRGSRRWATDRYKRVRTSPSAWTEEASLYYESIPVRGFPMFRFACDAMVDPVVLSSPLAKFVHRTSVSTTAQAFVLFQCQSHVHSIRRVHCFKPFV